MKKYIIFVVTLLFILSSCATPIDTSQFTLDNPYILENAQLDENMSNIAVPAKHQKHSIKNSQFEFLRDTAKLSTFRVKKLASKSYYYEIDEDDKPIYFTISDIEILEVISKLTDTHENINTGDVIRIFECFSFDPNGNYLAGISNYTIFENEIYTKFPYERLNDGSVATLFYLNNKYPLVASLRGEFYASSRPCMKFDTEYIMMLELGKFGSPAGTSGVVVALGQQNIPNEFIEGVIVNPLLFELSESAYNRARAHFPDNSSSDELRELGLREMEDIHYRDVWIIWELYGDKVNAEE